MREASKRLVSSSNSSCRVNSEECGADRTRRRSFSPKAALLHFKLTKDATSRVKSGSSILPHPRSALPSEADIAAEMTEVRLVPLPDSCTAASGRLFDHLVGADQNGIRDRQAQQLCGPGIEDQFKGGGFLDRNVSGLGTL
jgi:hypothetical protein